MSIENYVMEWRTFMLLVLESFMDLQSPGLP